jgi:hypothetical protein
LFLNNFDLTQTPRIYWYTPPCPKVTVPHHRKVGCNLKFGGAS